MWYPWILMVAAGELSKEWSQKITVNKDGSFDFSLT